ncbi:MAG: DNA translocase FtsK 4TM domain-containing protein, partial [Betaproteobacteria bacterium]|nr:DNA translocase FtsK 4TM domain-containing protein [Betaproteobacteria bacterium]
MLFSEKARPNRSAENPLPPKIASLVRESWWLALVALALYLALILFTFDKSDPGWSHSASVERIVNSGGRVGAWFADVLLYLFGLSAWWWVALCAFIVRWSFRRIEHVAPADRRSYFVAAIGFGILLVASASLEAMRFYSLKATLPLAPGGILGTAIGGLLSSALGFTGATLALLALIAIGLSLFTGISWIAFLERLGGWLEEVYQRTRQSWTDRQDRRAGAAAV